LLPVAFPRLPSEQSHKVQGVLKNKWAFISLYMPLNEATPLQRLGRCNETMRGFKSSPTPLVQYFVQKQLLPVLVRLGLGSLVRQTAFDLLVRHSMVFSNLPGAEHPITLCGHTLRGAQVVFANLVPQVTLISYGGGVFANICLDPDVAGGDNKMPSLFLDELRELARQLDVPCQDEDMLVPVSGEGAGVFGC
jgi:WS/DGAT C-terminal domain